MVVLIARCTALTHRGRCNLEVHGTHTRGCLAL